MRTVVFSDEATARKVNERFVAAWVNKSPKTKFGDGLYDRMTERTYKGYAIGNGVTNVTSIFATADGRVLHAVPGYLDVKHFTAEMEFALELQRKGWDAYGEAHRTAKPRGEFGSKAHERLAKSGVLTIEKLTFSYFNDFQSRGG